MAHGKRLVEPAKGHLALMTQDPHGSLHIGSQIDLPHVFSKMIDPGTDEMPASKKSSGLADQVDLEIGLTERICLIFWEMSMNEVSFPRALCSLGIIIAGKHIQLQTDGSTDPADSGLL